MVTTEVYDCLAGGMIAAAKSTGPVLEQLEPRRRVAVIMAILAIVLVGLLLVTCTMLGARWVRQIARQSPRPPRLDDLTPPSEKSPSPRAPLDGSSAPVDPNETVYLDPGKGETKVDP